MKLLYIIVLIFIFTADAYSQRACDNPSEISEIRSVGANLVVVLEKTYKVKDVSGRVTDVPGEPIELFQNDLTVIIDVLSVPGLSSKSATELLTSEQEPIASYKVDINGYFCLKDLPDGNYVLRVGTNKFAFMHTYLKVRKTKSGSKKPILIELEIGN